MTLSKNPLTSLSCDITPAKFKPKVSDFLKLKPGGSLLL